MGTLSSRLLLSSHSVISKYRCGPAIENVDQQVSKCKCAPAIENVDQQVSKYRCGLAIENVDLQVSKYKCGPAIENVDLMREFCMQQLYKGKAKIEYRRQAEKSRHGN